MRVKRASIERTGREEILENRLIAHETPAGNVETEHIVSRGTETRYLVQEPELSEEEELAVRDLINELLSPRAPDLSTESKLRMLNIVARRRRIDKERFAPIMYYLERDLEKYGRVTPLVLDAENLEDVETNRNFGVEVVHRKYGRLKTNVQLTEDEVNKLLVTIAERRGRSISRLEPHVEANLPEGRFAGMLGGEVSPFSFFTLRLYPARPLTLNKLVSFGSLSALQSAYLWLLLENYANILIAGAMASGKTTLANALLLMLDRRVRLITVEEEPELRLPHHDNWIPLFSRPSTAYAPTSRANIDLSDLIKRALWHSADYLIVGEVRSRDEIGAFLECIATGMGGLATIHAESVVSRLKALGVAGDLLPLIHISAYLVRKGRARRLHRICELADGEREVRMDFSDIDRLVESSKLLQEIEERKELDAGSEIERRVGFLETNLDASYSEFMSALDGFYRVGTRG